MLSLISSSPLPFLLKATSRYLHYLTPFTIQISRGFFLSLKTVEHVVIHCAAFIFSQSEYILNSSTPILRLLLLLNRFVSFQVAWYYFYVLHFFPKFLIHSFRLFPIPSVLYMFRYYVVVSFFWIDPFQTLSYLFFVCLHCLLLFDFSDFGYIFSLL